MYYVEKVGDFNLFMPSVDIVPEVRATVSRRQRMNADYLGGLSAPLMPTRSLRGSYICPHAPDYVGRPTLDWDQTQWQSLFQEMKAAGLQIVVFQAAIWHELGECYYQSRHFAGEYRMWQVVEPMLAAAHAVGIQVFLGGYGSVVGWLSNQDQALIDREIERQLACMAELLAIEPGFHGIYFSPETAFHGKREPERERMLNRLYRTYFTQIKAIAPEKPVAMSPASLFYEGMTKDFLDFWAGLLHQVPLDILMPQDSIGTAGCALSEQPAMWQLWQTIAQRQDLRLWCHLELFERREMGGPAPFVAADPRRVLAQLTHVEPYVEQCIGFEYPFFAGQAVGAEALRAELLALATPAMVEA